MASDNIKVTDRRMFTSDGELRADVERPDPPASAPPPDSPPAVTPAPEPAPAAPPGDDPSRRLEIPLTPEAGDSPGFFELAGVLAEPVALYLGDAKLPDGRSVEDLDMARFHIDLLEALRRKTAGNLTVEENAFLEDLLYRLRLRYVQKRG